MRLVLLFCAVLVHSLAFSQDVGGVIAGQIRGINGKPAPGIRVGIEFYPSPQRRGSIQGHLVVEGDFPVPDVSLQYAPVSGPASVNVPVDVNGLSATLPDGEYRVSVKGFPTTYYQLKSVTWGSVDLLREPLRVEGNSNVEVVITMRGVPAAPWGRVRGRVTGEQVPLTVYLIGETRTLQAMVDSSGHFEFPRVLPGSYSLNTAPYVGGIARSVTVGAGDSGLIDLSVPGLRQIHGRVVVEGGSPLPRSRFRVSVPGSGREGEADVQPDGTFVVTVPDGEHNVELINFPAPYRVKSIQYGSVDLLRQKMKVTAANPEEVIVTLEVNRPVPWVRVSGKVTGAERLPPSTRVVLAGNVARLFIDTVIDAAGEFVFPKVPPDTYTLRTEPPVYGMPGRTLVIQDKDVSVDLAVPEQQLLTVRTQVEGGRKRPGFSFHITRSDGKGYQIAFPAPLPYPLVLGRSDFECNSDVCSGAPLGRFLNELVVVPDASTPDTFTLKLPEGDYRMEIEYILPEYAVRSLTYGSTNLLKESFHLTGGETPEILVTFGPKP